MENNKFVINKNLRFPQDITKDNKKTIHFIGLGGIGMSGLAKFLLELGYNVSGSDIKDGPTMFAISAQGGTVYIGHTAENIGKASLVVVSSAIKIDNPELIEAQNRNLPILHRSQVLEALMSGLGLEEGAKQISIGVSGTHGKTTTSGMISLVFEDAKENPSVVVGGQMPYLNTNSKIGNGKYFIAELDESDGTIEFYSPDVNIITNLELDHPDHYVDGLNQLLETFERFIGKLNSDSKIIINIDDAGNRELLRRVNHPGILTYSIDPDNQEAVYTAKEITPNGLSSKAKVYKNNEYVGEINVGVPGVHNVSNALGTVTASLECGIKFENIAYSLERFTGMKRRFQILGTVEGARIVDDYAHHPTEIQATLKSAKSVVESDGSGRVVAVFQPHRYSRLANFWNDFVNSFQDADVVYVCDVYSACEKSVDNVNSEKLSQEIKHNNVVYAPGPIEKVSELVCKEIQPNDIVLTIGAGDITKLGHMIISKMGLDRIVRA